MTHLLGFETNRKPALTAAAFFLALGVSAPLAAAELAALADDGLLKLTTSGQAVGDGYVAPGFVVDGPAVSATPAPKARTPAAAPAAPAKLPAKAAETALAPVAAPAPTIEKVGSLDTVDLTPAAKPVPVMATSAEGVAVSALDAPVETASVAPVAVPVVTAAPQPVNTGEVKVAQAVAPGAVSPLQLAQLLAQAAESDANDPLEPVNRVIFEINYFLERLLLRPISEMYVLFLPQEARDSIRNFLRNVRTPIVLANDILQGEGERAWETTQRFFINSTVGVGGLLDMADRFGIKHHDEDLGQTFAVWGVGEIAYIVLPLLGPSNPRDAVGGFLDRYFDPVWYWTENTDRDEIGLARTLVSGVDSYSRVMDELKKMEKTSVDYYAAIRSIYRQKREADIRNGQARDVPLPDIRYDFNADVNVN